MPERKHNLPSSYQQLNDQIIGPVADSIVISPRSHGRLHLPGEHSTASRPPAHQVKITSTDPDNTSVYREERLLGDPGHYLVTYDIWNHRDSPTFAQIILQDQAQ
jgi:hypothetical protein